MRILGHRIGLVENDDLEGRTRISLLVIVRRVRQLHASKVLHLLTDDGYSTFIGGIELEHSRLHHFRTVELLGQGQDCRRLSRAGRSVEEHVRELCLQVS
ncbi:hypothetical protein CH063_09728 [Colletotrichum higginsianum]|uniref:Uncharacterized protein n=1 Tax=Colletotrichum higginsianum (strain IMI 349063) TaxID=759273 RepID=H1VEP6_COLHI|nr:hypothetical protein CH063_09728 [Colletotrichum higginsianum]